MVEKHSFIQYVLSLPQENPEERAIFIIPSKRAEKVLSASSSHYISELTGWVRYVTALKAPDELDMLLFLYQLQEQVLPNIDFEHFLWWGKLLLNDYSALDRAAVDKADFFTNLKRIKTLEQEVGHGRELDNSYTYSWERIESSYYALHNYLNEKGEATDATALDLLSNNEAMLFELAKRGAYYFCGFAAVEPALLKVINKLALHTKVTFVAELDPRTEGENYTHASKVVTAATSSLSPKVHIKYFAHNAYPHLLLKEEGNATKSQIVTKAVEQVKQHLHDGTENLAVIVADDTLLQPLREELATLEGLLFSRPPSLIQLPLARYVIKLMSYLLQPEQDHNLHYLTHAPLPEYPIPLDQLSTYEQAQYNDTLLMLINWLRSKEHHEYQQVAKALEEADSTYRSGFFQSSDTSVFLTLLKEILQSGNITEEVQPSFKVLIGGFLEFRMLEFKNVLLVGGSDSVLPSTSTGTSAFPYDIRAFYKLNTIDDQSALMSYYFFRSTQYAEKLTVLYQDTEQDEYAITRFATQLRKLVLPLYNASPSFSASPKERLAQLDIDPIRFPKDELYYEYVNKTLRAVSPSNIATYFSCSLRFYNEKVLKLEPPQEAEEGITQLIIGNIFHNAMAYLLGTEKQSSDGLVSFSVNMLRVEQLRAGKTAHIETDIQSALLKAVELECIANSNLNINIIYQKHLLELQIIELLIKNVLEKHLAHRKVANIELKLKEEIQLGSLKLQLKGIADLVLETDSGYEIVDYKTGSVKGRKWQVGEDSLLSPDQNHSFQVAIYMYMLYQLKKAPVSGSIIYIGRSKVQIKWGADQTEINSTNYREFELMLIRLIDDMQDPLKAIEQTLDTRTCSYCNFVDLCIR